VPAEELLLLRRPTGKDRIEKTQIDLFFCQLIRIFAAELCRFIV
jgi:hypothetical protein